MNKTVTIKENGCFDGLSPTLYPRTEKLNDRETIVWSTHLTDAALISSVQSDIRQQDRKGGKKAATQSYLMSWAAE